MISAGWGICVIPINSMVGRGRWPERKENPGCEGESVTLGFKNADCCARSWPNLAQDVSLTGKEIRHVRGNRPPWGPKMRIVGREVGPFVPKT